MNQTKDDQIQTRLNYFEKRKIGRSKLYCFNDSFQLVHADIANVEFLDKSVTTSCYVLLIVDLYSSKVYVYLMNSRKKLLQRLKEVYHEVQNKIKNIKMRQQEDNEFQQVKIKDLNDK